VLWAALKAPQLLLAIWPKAAPGAHSSLQDSSGQGRCRALLVSPPPQPELLMATPPSPTLNKFSLQGVPNCQLFYSTSINRNCKEKKKPPPIAMERAHFQ